jgi:hypothetical protein
MDKKKQIFIYCLLLTIPLVLGGYVQAENEYCTEILTLPYVINTQGVYCLKGHLKGTLTSGAAITIERNNVVIDLNGHKIGNLAAGAETQAYGIYAYNKKNITIRNGTIRGFLQGICLLDDPPFSPCTSKGHLIEDIRADRNWFVGINVTGCGNIIRNNQVLDTGGGGESQSPHAGIGIRVGGPSNRVINNDIIEFIEGSSQVAVGSGISLFLADASIVENNRIGNSAFGCGTSYGVFLIDSEGVLIVDNRISNMEYGVNYSNLSGYIRDNLTNGCITPFFGGIDAGNNFP